ncbi:MAG TPA: deoxyribonuclease IV [Terriglobales bacterium]|nr:deoxyribonuclease IV [Terriglobales bacterium]
MPRTLKPASVKEKKVTSPTERSSRVARTPPANRELAGKYDVLRLPPPASPPSLTRLKIGLHTSTSGGVETAAERAYRLGCNTFQIFSSSPRMWRPYQIGKPQADEMKRLREKYKIGPLVIHTSYLVNLCSATSEFLKKSVVAFRGEVERGLALGADYLVLHPGSFRGKTRQEGLACAAVSIAESVEGLDLEAGGLKILIENTAGAEFSLGGSFDQVAELTERLRKSVPVGACIDTCHTHVAGYDIVTEEGFTETMKKLDTSVGLKNVMVWHCNDAKSAFGSKLDRHQHIGQGTIGLPTFERLLNDRRTQHAAFIAETPIDAPFDDQRNVDALKNLVR